MKARPNPISKIESLMQFLFEDFWERIFPSPLEPAELEQKLERFMESQRSLLGDGRFSVPYIYDIYLSIKDHQQMSSGQKKDTLIQGWQTRLIDYAKHRQYVMREVPVLRLHGDSSLSVGKVRFEVGPDDSLNGEGGNTQQLDPSQLAALMAQYQAQQPPQNTFTPAAQSTQRSQQVPPTAASTGALSASTPPMPPARLLIRLPQTSPQTYVITKPVIGIGRQLDNDIIVEDKRVSRYHAQLKYQPDGQFALFDLGSTNGITINSIPSMRHHVLRNGDHFTIGSYDFQFERK